MLASNVGFDADASGDLRPRPDQSWDLGVPRTECCSSLEQRRSGTGTTHLKTWPGAQSFCRWLETSGGCAQLGWSAARLPSSVAPSGVRLLELGSGRGWLGTVLAKNLPGALLTLTDLPEAMSQLRKDVSGAVTTCGSSAAPIVRSLDWEDLACSDSGQSHLKSGLGSRPERARRRIEVAMPGALEYHTVFGTDLFWTEAGARCLAGALSCFAWSASPLGGPRVVFGHWNRSSSVTSFLVDELIAQGLSVKVLHPAGFHPRPGSFLHQLICPNSPMVGTKVIASDSVVSDAVMPDPFDLVPEGEPCVTDWTQEDWDDIHSDWLFEDAADKFFTSIVPGVRGGGTILYRSGSGARGNLRR
ncbi:unnamed protein product [Prorocentrum cordatum]|uniref:Uncharacterized protein n=1 Tax=Prorocentrum cordatum TaxID=2364126 RepID=A0ABN9S163_9DINO|nr:unnamed protein product [Polarella glacialis]